MGIFPGMKAVLVSRCTRLDGMSFHGEEMLTARLVHAEDYMQRRKGLNNGPVCTFVPLSPPTRK